MQLSGFLIVICALLCFSSTFSPESYETGTLIVSYDTGETEERLDRIRFLLITDDNDEHMYPKGDTFIENHECHSRVVAIEDLPPGQYRLRFLIPNADSLFDPIPEQTIEIIKDRIIRIDQSFSPKYAIPKDNKELADSTIIRRPHGGIIINQIYAQITVTTNLPEARWTLLRFNNPVYTGTGSVVNYQVPDGDNYRIVPEQIEGYSVRISQPSTFSLYPAQTQRVSINYERTFGIITIQAPFPNNTTVTIHLTSPKAPPQTIKLNSRDGKISWHSQPLPTGPYEITYELPPNFKPVAPENFVLHQGEKLQLKPQLFSKGALHVIANVPEAIFLLRAINDAKVWQGQGQEYTFYDIPPGTYRLSFSTQQPDLYLPPKEIFVTLNDMQNKEIKVSFQVAGKLTISTNIERSMATIQELGGQRKTYQEKILDHSKSFVLPEGRYRVTLTPFPEDANDKQTVSAPEPGEINVKALSSAEINLSFQINEKVIEKQHKLTVSANVPTAGFSLHKITANGQEFFGHYSGKTSQVTLPAGNRYQITFDAIPNFQTPEGLTFETKSGEEKGITIAYTPMLATAEVPEGKALIGTVSPKDNTNELPAKVVNISRFAIGIYEITNAQYADWLNQAVQAKTVVYISQDDDRGKVLDMNGHLLCKTFEADPYSQISAQQQSVDGPLFIPIAGKDSYPVLNVSWYGAVAYCNGNKCRLPTEAEWEKAAGMAPEIQGKPLKKYIYGFSRDTIDRSWANYKGSDSGKKGFYVLTTPVGYYNGTNPLPLDATQRAPQQTNLAVSPYGAFDMSGNVWEWVADWYHDDYTDDMSINNPKGPPEGTLKVAKGGCYDSLADGVRVSERIGLPPDHTDSYTGFRIAIDK